MYRDFAFASCRAAPVHGRLTFVIARVFGVASMLALGCAFQQRAEQLRICAAPFAGARIRRPNGALHGNGRWPPKAALVRFGRCYKHTLQTGWEDISGGRRKTDSMSKVFSPKC